MNAFYFLKKELQSHFPNFGRRQWLTYEIAVRMLADTLMMNVALILALILRYLLSVNMEPAVASTYPVLAEFIDAYLSTFGLVTPIGLLVFYSSGFYTRGRAYAGRYKVLIVAQAVSLTYLIFSLILFFLRDILPFPRTVLLIAWLLTLVFLIGARLWASLWSTLAVKDRRIQLSTSGSGETASVLVIGGAGYIGSALTQRLLELGYQVRVLDLLVYGDDPISQFYSHPNFELIKGDCRCIDTVVRAAKGMNAIVHLGAIVGDSACSLCEDLTIEINLRATRTIAEVGKGFGVKRFVFASTCSVYGASNEILDERSALCPISLYARTKMESEKVLLNLADASFAPTILRFGTVYGLSGRPRFDLVVNLLTAKAIQDGEAGIFGGEQWRPLVHVRDVAEAIVLTLRAPLPSVCGQVFNVGSNEQNYQIADLGPIIKDMVPSARIVIQPVEDNRNYRVRFDKIHNALNFWPRYTIYDGISEIIQSFAEGRITDYRDPHYNNFSFLKQNSDLTQVLVEDVDAWNWVKLSATDAILLTELVMAIIQTQSVELLGRLHKGMVQIMVGDVDGFLSILAGMQLASPLRSEVAPVPDQRRGLLKPQVPRSRSVVKPGMA
jgi:nucleoside-diphosphate-sugar epimerase